MNNNPIAVIDSGVGGLTVAKEILASLPGENIIYFGDSINCPYGNKTEDEIFALTVNMLRFLEAKGVKCVAIACNTISTMVQKLRPHFDFPIVSIIECGAKAVAKKDLSSVGLIATNFTVNSHNYDKLIAENMPGCDVTVAGVGSQNLAKIIDSGITEGKPVDDEIRLCVDKILDIKKVDNIILGCTHYPIVYNSFKKNYPDINFINPAVAQMNEIKRILTENGALNENGGSFELYSSGDTENYTRILSLLGSREPDRTETVIL